MMMRNRWVFSNILAGAASVQLFGPRTDYRRVLAQVQARAIRQGVSVDETFKQHMAERMLGQLLMAGTCLSAMGATVFGAAHGWSDVLLVPLAVVPMALMVLAGAAHQKTREQ
jgi:di/tricarboxylate transporter